LIVDDFMSANEVYYLIFDSKYRLRIYLQII
jgi:hypothetical protein